VSGLAHFNMYVIIKNSVLEIKKLIIYACLPALMEISSFDLQYNCLYFIMDIAICLAFAVGTNCIMCFLH